MHGNDIVCAAELTYDISQAGVLSESTFFREVLGEIDGMSHFCSFGRPCCVQVGCASHPFDLHHETGHTDKVPGNVGTSCGITS